MFWENLLAEILILASFILKASETIEIKTFLKMEILNSGFHR
jgi:hypothetical protein